MLHCPLTHWSRVTHICVGNLTIIGSDNGLSPGRRQAIIWTNAGILLIVPLGTNFNEIVIGIQTLSFKKMHLKMSSTKWRPFCLGLNELNLSVPFIYTRDLNLSLPMHAVDAWHPVTATEHMMVESGSQSDHTPATVTQCNTSISQNQKFAWFELFACILHTLVSYV